MLNFLTVFFLLVFLTGRVFLTQLTLPELFLTLSFPTDEPFVRSSSVLAERGGLAGHTHMTFALSGESRESKNGQILLINSAIDVDEGEGGVSKMSHMHAPLSLSHNPQMTSLLRNKGRSREGEREEGDKFGGFWAAGKLGSRDKSMIGI